MKSDSEIDAILARRKDIAAEMERLRTEDNELEIAVRVYRRYASPKAEAGNGAVPSTLGPPRPEGVPSLFEMTETVLREAIAAGKPGLKGHEIVTEIGKKYWPRVEGRQILPPIYAFTKKGRLVKNKDGIFRPVKKETAGA